MTNYKELFIYFFIIVLILVFVYLFFYTPQIISDNIYGISFGEMQIIYMNENKKLLSFILNHKDYDGSLFANHVRKGLICSKPLKEKDVVTYDYKPHQCLSNKKILQYSKFTSSVCDLLNKMMKKQKREIKVCIIVSIRGKGEEYNSEKGNFIKFAYYTIIPSDDIFDICMKHDTSVKNTQSEKYTNKNTTFYDYFNFFIDADYVFDNWRDI